MNDIKQLTIICFLGISLLAATLSVCWGAINSLPIDVAAIQFGSTIVGVFGALLTSRAQSPPPPPTP